MQVRQTIIHRVRIDIWRKTDLLEVAKAKDSGPINSRSGILTEAAKNAMYLKEFVAEIELRHLLPITIFNDNLGAQLLSKNAIVHPRNI